MYKMIFSLGSLQHRKRLVWTRLIEWAANSASVQLADWTKVLLHTEGIATVIAILTDVQIVESFQLY